MKNPLQSKVFDINACDLPCLLEMQEVALRGKDWYKTQGILLIILGQKCFREKSRDLPNFN